MVKKTYSKMIGRKEYSITHFPGDNAYAVYERDVDIQGVHIIPELATFGSEEAARGFIDNLEKGG